MQDPESETILIVEDDRESAKAAAEIVSDLGYEAIICTTFDEGVETAIRTDPALILFDRVLPGGDGADAIARLRLAGCQSMVIIVSALGRSTNRIEGLEKGADDYLAKPYDPDELRARIRAAMRRRDVQAVDNDMIAFADLEIRLKARTVHRGQRHVSVSPKEFKLLCFLARNEGQTVTRLQLLEEVWNLSFDPQTNVVDVHVGRLRRKLEESGESPLIHTVRGVGYVFALNPEP